ncbi:NitT/TauT family transport system ATP-binding protein [Caminicella sporogenes DSM 14501]|uniref:NitT/TauT family transport system ATP-binding protein n=1 Tax=Caminicella sporogenes DSM 14501 TaxID=1121266 RepID=A0A1M6P450_9FIRM|nr:ABC transporter ATP-binding protein [Caminicella sporogenes]RKD21536.1 spermidine/putrescine ABC transporter ATP-binding protein [Caminicella sporogenes]SHK02701.1 NitT/TauT family transport system ATP-binding protein [Caminicella sporogenes DSM 14501]
MIYSDKVVEIQNLYKTYHTITEETLAISNLSLSVYKNEIVSIVGPSGCGKSTLLSLIAGLIKPSSGKIFINGIEVKKCDKKIGYMFQNDNLFEWRNIIKNVLIGLEVQNRLTKDKIAKAEKLLEIYGLGDFKYHYPNQLSGGMRQRVALIRTLATEPELLLLDEPFSALDYQTRLRVADDVGTIIKKEKKTAILVTHDLAEAISMSDRVIVLSGRPAKIKSIHEIKLTLDVERTPLTSRKAPEFKDYFNIIWKELDIHE